MDKAVLGLPLDAALERLAQAGVTAPEIEYTRAPRDEKGEGTLRVIRQNREGARLTAAYFADQVRNDA